MNLRLPVKAILLAILAVAAAAGQSARALPFYTVSRDVTLSSSAAVVTVQQPASGGRTVQFVEAYVYCSVACDVTVERNGTAATSTAATIARNNPDITPAPAATAWHTSNVGAGSYAVGPFPIAAGGYSTMDLGSYQMRGDGTGNNFTLRTNSITGRVVMVIKWVEFQQ